MSFTPFPNRKNQRKTLKITDENVIEHNSVYKGKEV